MGYYIPKKIIKISSIRITFFQSKNKNFKKMFFHKFPNLLYFFLQLFLQKNFGFSWLKYFRNLSALWSVIFLRSLSLACKRVFFSGLFSCEEMQKKSMQISPFKFFIIEEVMSSSLVVFKSLNLNSPEKGKVILFPLIQKFRKVSNFTQVSITQATNKQSNNNYINIPKFIILGCYIRFR